MRKLVLFFAALLIVCCTSDWQTRVEKINDRADSMSNDDIMEAVGKLSVEIERQAKHIGQGIEFVRLAARMKTAARKSPNLPQQIVELLRLKAEQYHKKGSKLILQQNPSLFDDL